MSNESVKIDIEVTIQIDINNRIKMDDYLKHLLQNLNKITTTSQEIQLEIVIGNESCDLDSAVSAIVFAYHLHKKNQREKRTSVVIPILNIPKREFRLRTEVRRVLRVLFGSEIDDRLIFSDTPELKSGLEASFAVNQLEITLVDHHELSNELKQFGPAVRRVIDHHPPDEKRAYDQVANENYINQKVGSCSTFVYERIDRSILEEDGKIAKLLLGAILIDTSKLMDDTHKTTENDRTAVKNLENSAMLQGNFDRNQWHEEIERAKIDITGFTIEDILAKDYKAIGRIEKEKAANRKLSSVGLSTVPLPFEDLWSKAQSSNPEHEFESFRTSRNVDALVLSCVNKGKDIPRDRMKQVVLFGGTNDEKDAMHHALLTIDGLELTSAQGLDGVNVPTSILVYYQRDPSLGRKDLLPALKRMLEGTATDSSTGSQSPPPNSGGGTGGGAGGGNQPTSGASPSQPAASSESPETQRGGSSGTGGGAPTHTTSRGKRFLDSTELARSFSVTYDDDEDAAEEYSDIAGPSHQDIPWHGDMRSSGGNLGTIDEHHLSSLENPASYEDDRPSDDVSSFSHSTTTEDEMKHYPTVSSPYAVSSYDGGGLANGGGSGTTQEESVATLSGVPDLLDSRENLADVVAGVSDDTPDLLVDYQSPTDSPYAIRRTLDEGGGGGEIDLLQGTTAAFAAGGGGAGNFNAGSTESQPHDEYHLEVSFSSYPPDIAVNYRQEEDDGKMAAGDRDMKRDLSEPQFQFSSDPSPSNRSRADTPPSSPSTVPPGIGGNGRRFLVGMDEFDPKAPGYRTPPNTFVESYLEGAAAGAASSNSTAATSMMTDAARRRSSQQSAELEPELLYLKLKGSQFSIKDQSFPSSSSAFSSGGLFIRGGAAGDDGSSVPDTPPNSFMGTPVVSTMELAAAAGASGTVQPSSSPPWDSYQIAVGRRRDSQIEPENLRQRVSELKKNLASEDGVGMEYYRHQENTNGALIGERDFYADMDKESPCSYNDVVNNSAPGIVVNNESRTADFVNDQQRSIENYYQNGPSSDLSELDQYAEQLSDVVLTKALAEVYYPEVADDDGGIGGFVNPAFGTDSSTTSPLSPANRAVVFANLNATERSLPDVLSENFQSPVANPTSMIRPPIKTPLSTKSSSDLLSTTTGGANVDSPSRGGGLAFDLVSCASGASFGRESTVAHADSTEFNIGPRRNDGTTRTTTAIGASMANVDPRVETDFNDEDEFGDGEESAAGDGGSIRNGGVGGIQWEEEGYPALLDIHREDSTRLFSDEPGGFNAIHPVPAAGDGSTPFPDSEAEEIVVKLDQDLTSPSSGSSTKRKSMMTTAADRENRDEELGSPATESGPDSPDTESADGEGDGDDGRMEMEEGTSTAGEKMTIGDGLEWENDTPVLSPQKQASHQWAAAADMAEERRWRTVSVNGVNHRVDMAAVEPYRRIISHGGYYGEGLNAIAVFASCYLPSRSEPEYNYLMDNLFLYAVSMLDTLVADDYVIIYFQGGSTGEQMPPFSWLRKCYQLIDRRHVSHTEVGLDRRLRKNLKAIYLVHPTLWLKTVVTMAKPFISSKFSKKVYFIQQLNDLGKLICMDQVEIPDEVLKHDHERVFARTYTGAAASSANGSRTAATASNQQLDESSGRRTSATTGGNATATTNTNAMASSTIEGADLL